jgi:rhodanese-related sulfurtransferase
MKEITVRELQALRESGEAFQLIDVREEHEYDAANLGGTLMPMGTVFDNVDQISREIPVVVHCRSGSRSAAVIRELEIRHGFTNLSNLKGGIIAWSREIDPTLSVS